MNYILHALSLPFVYFNRRSQRVTNNARTAKTNYKVALIGDSLSGKSCLLMSFLHNQFNLNHTGVGGEMFYTKIIQIDGKSIDLFLIDTVGLTEFDRLRPLSYVGTDITLICFNVDDPQSLTNVIEKWMPEIRHYCPRCPVVLVACKIDLREDRETISKLKEQDEKPIKTKVGMKTASKLHADAYIECSAKTHEGVEELFVTATHLALKKTLSTPAK